MALFIDGGASLLKGDNNLITQNQIMDNIEAFDITNSIGTAITGNDILNNGVILMLATNTGNSILYYNNFINNTVVLIIPFPGPTVEGIVPFSPAGQWDNGTIGNYWSNYLITYPNATEINHTGIGNTPYVITANLTCSIENAAGLNSTGIAVLGTATDNYPLMAPTSDATLLKISLLSPLNQKYNDSIVPLVFTVDNAVDWTGYSLDGKQNVTITGNGTLTDMSNGLHNITIYANDTFGNLGSSQTNTFTVAKPEPFPTTTDAAFSGSLVAFVCVGLIFYLRKRKI
jgi:hypothetical protein